MPVLVHRLKAIQHPHGPEGKAGRVEVRSIPRLHTIYFFFFFFMSLDFVPCTYARPAGSRTDLAVLYVASGHHLEGETVICNLAPSQRWIADLSEGDTVYVRDRLRLGNKGDYLGDACANAKQPLFDQYGKEQPEAPIQTVVDLQAAYNSEGRDLPGTLRIDTYLSDPEHIAMLEKLTLHCSKKEAGHLLLKYAIKNLPVWTKQSAPSPIYDWLNNF